MATYEAKYREVMADKHGFRKWDFEPVEMCETGYESVMKELESYTSEMYLAEDEEGRKRIQEEVLKIYRSINIFPIKYYNYNGILNEIRKVQEYNLEWNGDTISGGAGVGTGVCKFLFPNLFDTVSSKDLTESKAGGETGFRKFYNDEFLKKAIRVALEYGSGSATPSAVMSGIGLVGALPTNFRPAIAKAIYEKFTNEGDTVFDFACGFGGRLLGAATSKKNLHYVGCDPNTETQVHLHELGEYIEKVTGRENSYELHTIGSEDFMMGEDTIDFAFSSPPYFDLELYSMEETQSVMKFPTLELWLEGFVRGVIKNIYQMLKPDCYYAVDIADFDLPGGIKCNFVDEWSRISEEEGFTRMPNLYMGVPNRGGSLEKKLGEEKRELIMVFKTNKSFW